MIVDLQGLLLIDSFDIIALTETWLDSDFRDSELQLNGYNIFRWENVTQQKKEQTNKIVLSCGTWLLNNFSVNETRKLGLYVFDPFSPDCTQSNQMLTIKYHLKYREFLFV